MSGSTDAAHQSPGTSVYEDYCELDEGVAVVPLVGTREPFTLTLETVGALLERWQAAVAAGARVIVLAGRPPIWCAGGDVRAFAGEADPSRYIDELADVLHRLVSEITRSEAICVAAVDGTVGGAGVPLAAAADIVVASERSRFTLGYTRLGLSPDGGTSLLTASIGLHRALQAALLNPTWSAEEAREAGLVARVVPEDALIATVVAVSAQVAATPAGALAATKRVIREQAHGAAEAALRREAMALRALAGGSDAAEGFRAFLEKRAPAFPTLQPAQRETAASTTVTPPDGM